jgi:hypothetical protein
VADRSNVVPLPIVVRAELREKLADAIAHLADAGSFLDPENVDADIARILVGVAGDCVEEVFRAMGGTAAQLVRITDNSDEHRAPVLAQVFDFAGAPCSRGDKQGEAKKEGGRALAMRVFCRRRSRQPLSQKDLDLRISGACCRSVYPLIRHKPRKDFGEPSDDV